MGQQHDYITRAEAELLVTRGIEGYELKVVAPRHVETQSSLTEIRDLVVGVRSIAWFLAAVGALVGVVWTVLQIKGALAH